MTVVLVAAAVVVAAGSVAALAAHDARFGLVGLAGALVGAALVADPLPGPAVLGVRLTAALLAVALLRATEPAAGSRANASEPDAETRSHLGWPAEALLGAAGGIAGLAISAGLDSFVPLTGTDVGAGTGSIAAAFPSVASVSLALAGGLIAIALPPLVMGRSLRRAIAAVLAVEGALLARIGLAGPPSVLEEVVLASLLVAVAAAAALLASAGRASAGAGARPS